jgi:hypothetical protein
MKTDSNSTSSVTRRWLPRSLLMKQQANRLGYQKTIAKSLVIAVLNVLMKQLAIPLSTIKLCKWLVMSSSFARRRLGSPSKWPWNEHNLIAAVAAYPNSASSLRSTP